MRLLSRQCGLVAALLFPAAASAFTFESVVTGGCHESITVEALARVGWPEPAPEATSDDRLLEANLPFRPPPGANAWLLAILVGVRDNDLHGNALTEFGALAPYHNGLATQDEHCLRGPNDDGDDGDASAIASCKAFIHSEAELALGSVDELSVGEVEAHAVALRFEKTSLPFSRFAFHAGRALHALQDSFTHAFRSEDYRSVLSVFNYVDPAVSNGYSPGRDGHAHIGFFDACDSAASSPGSRSAAALHASESLLSALKAPGTRAQRLASVDVMLDAWLGLTPGCNADNDFCGQAPEPAHGCSSGGGGPLMVGVLAGLCLWARRRRRRHRGGAGQGDRVLQEAGTSSVRSEPVEGPRRRTRLPCAAGPSLLHLAAAACALVALPVRAAALELHGAAGASIDRGAAVAALGTSVSLSRVTLGVDVEYGPWFDIATGSIAPGALSVYGSVGFAWFESPRVTLSSVVQVGASALLFAMPGAARGSIGLHLGAAPVRVSLPISNRLAIELSPEAVLVAPSLRGVPLTYHQYRFTVGFRFRAW